ncbi:hypothetical protein CEXT_578011 [Caerostris extrusa]|uniref:Uncharacterized protein n=1 Tax=Caerostris extrusa TaxID=172846 RepID=A0AAV4S454_CAEEX|nr:hypothetical protein CEXT_578011 [Caerostris extrusa]
MQTAPQLMSPIEKNVQNIEENPFQKKPSSTTSIQISRTSRDSSIGILPNSISKKKIFYEPHSLADIATSKNYTTEIIPETFKNNLL